MAQTIKNLPAMQETRIKSLGGEDPLDKLAHYTFTHLPHESSQEGLYVVHYPRTAHLAFTASTCIC